MTLRAVRKSLAYASRLGLWWPSAAFLPAHDRSPVFGLARKGESEFADCHDGNRPDLALRELQPGRCHRLHPAERLRPASGIAAKVQWKKNAE